MDRCFEFASRTTCRIVVGHRIEADLAGHLAGFRPDQTILIHDLAVTPLAERLARQLAAHTLPLPTSAATKDLTVVGDLAERLARLRATRSTLLVALGGGTVSDVVGFLGAIYLRGLRTVFCPTTTLALCDAALGGKNGVDLGGLKNRLGTISQPALVFADVAWLDTLPDAAFREGLVEVVKKAAVLDAAHFATLERLAPALRAHDPDATLRAAELAVAMKMAVVQADEREAGLRMTLNFGHTIGHALESRSGQTLGHGHAVAMGMLAECRAAGATVPGDVHDRLAALLHALGVEPGIPVALRDADALWELARTDKKAAHGRVPMVVPGAIGTHTTVDLTRDDLERALA